MPEAVAVTAVNLICPLGHEAASIRENLRRGQSGLDFSAPADFPELAQTPRGQIKLDFLNLLGGTGWRHYSRSGLMAVWSSRLLLQERKNSSPVLPDPENTGVALGYNYDASLLATCAASFAPAIAEKDLHLINPALFINISNNTPASQISIQHQLRGPIFTITTGFTGGLEALDTAATVIRGGHAPLMLAGAVQEAGENLALSFHALADRGPDSRLHFGAGQKIACGEGCTLLALEPGSTASSPRAFLLGFGQGFNPRAAATGDPAAAIQAVRAALAEAGLTPADIGAIFWAANGDPVLDGAETRAMQTIFRTPPPGAALKSFWGETYYAGGAMSAGAAILCLEKGFLPPTLNIVPGADTAALGWASQARTLNARTALVMALDRDQKAAALILGLPDGGRTC